MYVYSSTIRFLIKLQNKNGSLNSILDYLRVHVNVRVSVSVLVRMCVIYFYASILLYQEDVQMMCSSVLCLCINIIIILPIHSLFKFFPQSYSKFT